MDAGPHRSAGAAMAHDPVAVTSSGVPGSSRRTAAEAEEEDEEDGSDDGAEEDSEDDGDSIDSEGDLEGILPRKGAGAGDGQPRQVKPSQKFEKWQPPPGTTPISVSTDMRDSPFEYSKLASNPNLQLWTIRVPNDFKPSRLSSLQLSFDGTVPSGSLKTKSATYTLSSSVASSSNLLPRRAADSMAIDSEHPGNVTRTEGAEEMSGGMRLMVPNLSRGGKWQIAPIPITHHLLLTPDLSVSQEPEEAIEGVQPLPSFLATQPPTSTSTPADQIEGLGGPSRPKREQPTHLLKFRNRVSGFDTPGHLATSGFMSGVEQASEGRLVDEAAAMSPTGVDRRDTKEKHRGKEKTKKRKSDGAPEVPSRKKKEKA